MGTGVQDRFTSGSIWCLSPYQYVKHDGFKVAGTDAVNLRLPPAVGQRQTESHLNDYLRRLLMSATIPSDKMHIDAGSGVMMDEDSP